MSGPVPKEVVSLGDATFNITWSPPANSNGVILSYSVIITDISDGSTVRQESAIPTNMLNIIASGLGGLVLIIVIYFCGFFLAAGVPYSVSVVAVNRAGDGEANVTIHFTQQLRN